jgi:hypothetical protein
MFKRGCPKETAGPGLFLDLLTLGTNQLIFLLKIKDSSLARSLRFPNL